MIIKDKLKSESEAIKKGYKHVIPIWAIGFTHNPSKYFLAVELVEEE